MLRNFFVIAVRNIFRNKMHSAINILGLAISFAVAILITFWIQYDYSYDRFHENIDDIYMVSSFVYYGPQKNFVPGSPPALAPAIEREFPQILKAGRLSTGTYRVLIQTGDHAFKENIDMLDPSLFDIFSFPFVKGDFEVGESNPHVIALSESKARKIFGDTDPIGQIVMIDETYRFEVVGVFKDIPGNSYHWFDFVVPLSFLEEYVGQEDYTRTWYNCSFRSYALLDEGADIAQLDSLLAGRCRQSYPASDLEPTLYPYKDIHMVLYGYSRRAMVFVYICLFIILTAVINFTNLSTAGALKRSREIGIRKVHGSSRLQLVAQFMGESILIAFVSLLISFLLVELSLPLFNNLTGESFSFANFFTLKLVAVIMGITLLSGVLASIYPAFLLSSFNPVQVLNNPDFKIGGKSMLRKLLVIVQYVISSILFICLIIFMQQIRFMIQKDLGYDRENLVCVTIEGNLLDHTETWKNDLLASPNIQSATLTSHLPSGIWYNSSGWDWDGRREDQIFLVTILNADRDYLKTMDIELLTGNYFPEGKASENTEDIVINEEFSRRIGVENPIGMTLYYRDISCRVIGVVENFNYKSLEHEMEPLMIMNAKSNSVFDSAPYRYIIMRILPGRISETLEYIRKVTTLHNPKYPFSYEFLDEKLENLYRSSRRFMNLVGIFAILALSISSLGLFGLASYIASQRRREVSIRKVLGASITRISLSMILDFCKWVLISNLFAWPIAWYLMRYFLSSYPYQVKITVMPFLLTTAITFMIAVLTVSWQTLKVAFTAPTRTLKYE